jgi:hypothetical protein
MAELAPQNTPIRPVRFASVPITYEFSETYSASVPITYEFSETYSASVPITYEFSGEYA